MPPRVVMPGMISNDEWNCWVERALSEFRQRWRGHPLKIVSETTGLPKNTASRWVNLGCGPSKMTLPVFRRACILSGIDVGEKL